MGFWGSLAGLGASLIPGAGPFIAPIVGGVVDGFTSKKGGGSGSANPTTMDKSAQENKLDPGFDNLTKGLTDTGDYGSSSGKRNIDSSSETLQGPKNYFSGLLNGNQEELQGLLNPEVSTVLNQYDTAARAATEFAPRGGGRNRTLSELPTLKAGVYQKAVQGARANAAGSLAAIAGQEANLGTNLLSQGTSARSQASANDLNKRSSDQSAITADRNFYLGKSSTDLAWQQRDDQKWSGLGAAIAKILPSLGSVFKGLGGQNGESGASSINFGGSEGEGPQ